ncbi:vacuolar protein sorting-associated protein 35 [Kluyveromyces marxianus DMKU3-1042]|uniref:Vacuolar protein sorting-associated protein 35 n=1 Tax=Kluyveromyces marxianus (strain DMKU3-1042 / BCC 29191 / NBRC 104275) TaxID=1003335 RepID=W0TD09_KLUMD|nr:vacuolar protein sorting-associated protein 35 [Kluyveromyces marxianus DMKU3-1042]BAO40913.1 vacuolar protein sorting-associated protein 35 [Kluyveromyces marxianus DMKU3-1042]
MAAVLPYSENMEQAISHIKQQTILMQRSLVQKKLMDALKHCSDMLKELRNPDLSPKLYYELYIMIYDSLSILSQYLVENHPTRHHLADLYELVQYTGNILPRLYLMITVGVSFMQTKDCPAEEVLKDMIEMCRGVQHPIRGLFLRYYLSQRTKQSLTTDISLDKKFDVQFIITNFIEMNKLWVRLQHQGPLRERDIRTKERKELQILIGSNLVRLSQILDDSFILYKNEVLPQILEQVVQCRDVVSQEYLLDVICQVFPDEFHLGTLSQLLDTTLKLNPDVSINKVVLSLIARLNGYLDRQDDPAKSIEALKDLHLNDQEESSDTKNDADSGKPDEAVSESAPQPSFDLFFVFWKYLTKIVEERPDLPLHEIIPLVHSIMILSMKWYPSNLSNVEILYKFCWERYEDFGKEIPEECEQCFKELFLYPLGTDLFYDIITTCDSFQKLLSVQSVPLQKNIIDSILDKILSSDIKIKDKSHLEKIGLICEPIIQMPNDRAKTSILNVDDDLEDELVFLNAEQEKLAKIVHLIYHPNVEQHTELLLICKNRYYKGGKQIRFTYPAIVTAFWKLIRKLHFKGLKRPQKKEKYNATIKQLFKYISRCHTDLFNICGISICDLLFKLNLQTAALADQLSLSEISYDFFSQAFSIFEESLSDSKVQFQAIVNMAQVLQKTRSLYNEENYYDTLITRCTLHGSKLLKKADQCRAVYLCSHLWWATELSLVGEEEGVTKNFFREGKRVLECLQRSLRVADSVMDNIQSCQLMVEILGRCCYYFIHGDESETHVGVKYIAGLIELIQANLKGLLLEESTDAQDATVPAQKIVIGCDGSYICKTLTSSTCRVSLKTPNVRVSDLIAVPVSYFERTLQYIENQKQVDDRFNAIAT